MLAAIIAIQQLEGNVFYPLVVGKQLKLHPVAILLALTAGGVLAGVAGAFLAIPVAAVVSAVLDVVRTRRRRQERGRDPHGVALPRMDAAMRDYYEQRAPEYDDWWLGTGLFASRDRPGWDEDVAALQAALAALPPARTLDVACGTGFLTRHLPGELTGLDQSAGMLEIAGARIPRATFVQGDALDPPFGRGAFERVHARTSTATCCRSSAGRSSRGAAARGRARDRRLRAAARWRGGALAGARAQRRLAPPRLQALVHGRRSRRGARRRRDRARRPVVRGRALRALEPGGPERGARLALAEARSAPGSGAPPRQRGRRSARRSPGRA